MNFIVVVLIKFIGIRPPSLSITEIPNFFGATGWIRAFKRTDTSCMALIVSECWTHWGYLVSEKIRQLQKASFSMTRSDLSDLPISLYMIYGWLHTTKKVVSMDL